MANGTINKNIKYKDSANITFTFDNSNSCVMSINNIASLSGINRDSIYHIDLIPASGWQTYIPMVVYNKADRNIVVYISGIASISPIAILRVFFE